MNIAEKNIKALQKNPFGEIVIKKMADKNKDEEVHYLLKSNISIAEEIKIIEKKLDFNHHCNFILIGAGNGELIESIYKKMSNLSTFTIIEKNKNVLINLLGTKDLSKVFKDNRVCLLIGNLDEISATLDIRFTVKEFAFNIKNTKIITLPYMKSMDEKYVDECLYRIVSKLKYLLLNFGNDINDILEGMDHIVENWDNILRGLGINGFKDKYKGVPAIIVSAGPSLDKNIEALKRVYGKALILTVDATAQKVMKLGVTPDAISTIERPEVMDSIFYEKMDLSKEPIFLGPPVVTKKILNRFNNLIITGRSGEIIVKSVMNLLGHDSLELGISCAHIPFAFAKYIGADPIIFIGQDLAFTKEGVTHFEEASEVAKEGARNEEMAWVMGNDGEKLPTAEVFTKFLTWFENEISNAPKTTFINATEGGARIKGTKVMKFSEVIDIYCKNKITSLYESYKKIVSEDKPMNKAEETNKLILLLNNFIDDCDRLKSESDKNNELIIKLAENNKTDVNKFQEILKSYDNIFDENRLLQFLFQPILVSCFRSFHGYSINMSELEWQKLLFEGKDYCKKIHEVSEALKIKFKEYIIMVNNLEKGDMIEDKLHDK